MVRSDVKQVIIDLRKAGIQNEFQPYDRKSKSKSFSAGARSTTTSPSSLRKNLWRMKKKSTYKKRVTINHRCKKAFGHHSLNRQHSHHPPHVTSNFYFNKANQEMDVVVSKDASKEKTLEHEELLEHIRSFHSSKLPFI